MLSLPFLQTPTTHLVFEILAYCLAGQIYRHQIAKTQQPPWLDRWRLLSCAVFGALVGSKLLHVLQHLTFLLQPGTSIEMWLSGKSVLGGFIGGTWAVEIGKKYLKWPHSTGDAWVFPLVVGLSVGRIGCQLSGTWDATYGLPTELPWAWNYGDGVPRHPTALYEICAVLVIFSMISRIPRSWVGVRFDAFLLAYCGLRFGLEFLKPPFGDEPGVLPAVLYAGLSAIQWAALCGIVYFLWHLFYVRLPQRTPKNNRNTPIALPILPTLD